MLIQETNLPGKWRLPGNRASCNKIVIVVPHFLQKKKIPKALPVVTITSATDTSMISTTDSNKKKKKKKKLENEPVALESEKKPDKLSGFTSGIRKKLDRALNSPSMTKDLLGSSPDLKRKTSPETLVQQENEEVTIVM